MTTILVIEDDHDHYHLIEQAFDGMYQVVHADTGAAGIQEAQRIRPDLILLDINLPDIDGLEIARRLKASAVLAKTPIIAVTARAMKGDREKCLAAGCDDYVSKPVNVISLRDVLERYLEEMANGQTKQSRAIMQEQCVSKATKGGTVSTFINDDNVSDLLNELNRVKQPTVLVVDDIEDNLDLVEEIFEDEPFNIVTAQSAKQAWPILKQTHPDLVLLDVQMPDIDGYELCAAIKKQPDLCNIPIIFLTANKIGEDHIVSGLDHGADDYICKPFEREVLMARIRAVLRKAARK